MAGPEHAGLAPPPAFGFGAAHLRAAAPATSQPRPLHRGMPADCLTKWLPSDKLRRSVEYMTNRRAAPEATAAYSEITLDDIADAIANVSDHSHDGNLHDRAYQVGGSVVSDPVSTVR